MASRRSRVVRPCNRARARKNAPRPQASSRSGLPAGEALALGAGLVVAPALAEAAVFQVTITADERDVAHGGADADTGLSLREAIIDANNAAGADTITFAAGVTPQITLTDGQLEVSDAVDIQGPGAAVLKVSGNNASRVFYLYSSVAAIDVTISGLTIADGAAPTYGGGIVDWNADLILDHVVLSGNNAADGGGLAAPEAVPSITIRDCEITGNSASNDGGGIKLYSYDATGPALIQRTAITGNDAGGDGGGVYLYGIDEDVTFEDCTISGNSAGGNGGGVYLDDTDGGALTLARTTISGNSAYAYGGGAAFFAPDDAVVFENCTISGNDAGSDGGGIAVELPGEGAYGSVELRHTTVAGNSAYGYGGGVGLYGGALAAENCIVADNSASYDDDISEYGGSFDLTYTLVEDTGNANYNDNGGNVFGSDPQLGPLQDNGGLTETQAIGTTSPAFNAGDPAFSPPPATDQRGTGFDRVFGGQLDMGAYEFQIFENIPILGGAGTAALAGLIAGAALLALRRRTLAAPVLIFTLVGAGIAAGEGGAPEGNAKENGSAANVTLAGGQYSVRNADGSIVVFPASAVEIKDRRNGKGRHRATTARAASGEQAAVVRVRHGRDGSVKKVKIILVDSLAQAQTMTGAALE